MEEKMIQNVADDSANSVPVTSMVSPGLDPKDPAAIEAMNNSLRLRGRDVLRAGVMGAAAGSQVGQQAGDPRSAFIQGMAAGMGATDTIFKERRQELQTAADMIPFGETHPEIVNSSPAYHMFKGLPTKLVLQSIKQIGVDAAKIQAESNARMAEQTNANDLSTIKDINEAAPYARMANQSYGLTGADSISPEELIGMKKGDVDNMIRMRTGKVSPEENPQITEPIEVAPMDLAAQYGLPSQRVNPYHKMPEKVYEKVRAANAVLANKVVDKSQSAADAMANAVNSLQRAKSILDGGLNTGPIRQTVRFKATQSSEAQEFDQIASAILPSMRQGMPGAVSDRDIAIFKEANFGLNKDEKVNRKIINQQLAVATRVKDKAEFLSNWATVYGDMAGAEANWAKYVKSNPLFTATGEINPNIKTYNEYFTKSDTKSSPSNPIIVRKGPDGKMYRYDSVTHENLGAE